MLQVDWMVRGVWEGSRVAFFDNRIVDADAPSYVQANLSWEAIANRAASTKKKRPLHFQGTSCLLHTTHVFH